MPSIVPEGRVHVVAAVIEGAHGQVLIGRRAADSHQGGLWEFPGGKLEPGESELHALARELNEELGIHVRAASPLIKVCHDYPDKSVLLSVWRVHSFDGQAHGREGQPIRWIDVTALDRYDFPKANRPIIRATTLPAHYLITPPALSSPEQFAAQVQRAQSKGVRLIQLRVPGAGVGFFGECLDAIGSIPGRERLRVVVNGEPERVAGLGADGIHLPWRSASVLRASELEAFALVGVSAHSPDQLRQAGRLNADFAVLGPVRTTLSHPDVAALGWRRFAAIIEQATLPVFALGGMSARDQLIARHCGAQGIAGISLFMD